MADFDTGWKRAYAYGDDYNQWYRPYNAYTNNGVSSDEYSPNHKQDWYNFSFGIPAGVFIKGIEVELEAYETAGSCTLGVEVSWNGGTNYTTTGKQQSFPNYYSKRNYGGSSDLWERSWSASEFSDANFRVRVDCISVISQVRLDYIWVKVYYSTVGSETEWKPPTNNGDDFTSWTNPTDAYSSNDIRAYASANGAAHDWYDFSFDVPSGSTILGIEGNIEGRYASACGIDVALSWDGGSTYTSVKNLPASNWTAADTLVTVGDSSDLWGRVNWQTHELGNDNFRVKIIKNTEQEAVNFEIDYIQFRIHYIPPGGAVMFGSVF